MNNFTYFCIISYYFKLLF